MLVKDFDLVKDIFSVIDCGIVEGYDSFRVEARVGDAYVDIELVVERGGVEVSNAETNFDDSVLYDLIMKLKESFALRGECWISFVMSYEHGGQVKTNFKYSDE
ncbi:hypothetical protein [Achromobacter deleyi]|uniref:hypothetical protein n=1 Tax=Achromobacter deleyi TaxID=1353891 RepID=UPI001466F711|nr:hypothetical protein [Achromobacter deleyi]CAB3928880.1 hypothetical protein LMG3412_06484 [Achromobacter deleyi]